MQYIEYNPIIKPTTALGEQGTGKGFQHMELEAGHG